MQLPGQGAAAIGDGGGKVRTEDYKAETPPADVVFPGVKADKVRAAAEAKGLKVIAGWENGYRHITNSKRPINSPADLQLLSDLDELRILRGSVPPTCTRTSPTFTSPSPWPAPVTAWSSA